MQYWLSDVLFIEETDEVFITQLELEARALSYNATPPLVTLTFLTFSCWNYHLGITKVSDNNLQGFRSAGCRVSFSQGLRKLPLCALISKMSLKPHFLGFQIYSSASVLISDRTRISEPSRV